MAATTDYADEDVYESLSRRSFDMDPTTGIAEGPAETTRAPYDEAADRRDPGLWYPDADRSISMPTQDYYPDRYPMGALVHFTAGRCDRGDPDAAATARYGAQNKYCFFCISRTGKVYQTAPLSRWGYHSGKSYWSGLGNYVHSKIVGIEVCNAGLLKKTERGYEPWWNKPGDSKNTYYAEEQVRFVEREHNVGDRGYYLRYTPEQEKSLVDLILWMHEANPKVFKLDYVVGHDEVSPKRKNDPGGALSFFMPAFRAHLVAEAKARAEAAANPQPKPEPVQAAIQPVPPAQSETGSQPAPAEQPAPAVAAPPAPAPAPSPAPAATSPANVAAASQAGPPDASMHGLPVGPRFMELLRTCEATVVDHPQLKAIAFAQWAHESGFGTSELAVKHLNFAGMKWREQMRPLAKPVFYRPQHDPADDQYCGFADLESFVAGYWHRLDIPALPYAGKDGGWRKHAETPERFLDFIGPIWAPEGGDNSPLNNGYIKKVWAVYRKLEAAGLLPAAKPAATA
jgi:N-acetyl-anhydromuramyl-L-alanine amidase AmpD